MGAKTKTTQTAKKPGRITRSISFPLEVHALITKRAAEQRRSFNWVVNDILARS